MTKYFKQRDSLPVISDTLLDASGIACNVSGATVYFMARVAGESEYQVCEQATASAASSGQVWFTPSATSFPRSGTYEYDWCVVDTSGSYTVPTYGHGELIVEDDIADVGLSGTHASGTINVSASTLDNTGTQLGVVPPGSKVFAYIGTQPVAVADATSSGNFSLTLVDGLTYTLKYRYSGYANAPTRTVSL